MSSLRRFGKTIVRNWWLKLLAFVLAVMSFFAIRGATSFEVPYDIPLVVEVEKGIAILDQEPRTVQVTFRGSREDLRRLEPNSIRAVVKTESATLEKSDHVPVGPANVEGHSPARVVSVKPGTVRLIFDRETSKRVPVAKPRTDGTPLIGRVEIDYEPKEVTLRGPHRRLAQTEMVRTAPVDVDGRVESFTKRIPVLSPGDTWISQIEPPEIMVKVSIVTESATRQWEKVPVRAFVDPGAPVRVSMDPRTVDISLHGRAEVLEGIEATDLTVFVDCMGLKDTATYQLPVNCHLPPGTDLAVQVDPEMVDVEFRRVTTPPAP